MNGAPLVLAATSSDGWVVLQSGRLSIATFAGFVKGGDGKLIMSALVSAGDAS